jgi:hypothetical protein
MKSLKKFISKLLSGGIAVIAALCILIPSLAYGQAELTGTIIITVKDEQDAVLPGVQLSLMSAATTLTGATNQVGKYKFVLVPAATYELKAELEGFQAVTMPDIRVNFGETYVYEIVMKLGTLEETITVTATPQIDVTLTTTKELIEPEVIENLPLRDRNFQDVLKLMPGVNDDKVRGSRSTNTGYRIDGANNMDPFYSEIAIVFSQEAIDRFELIPGGFQAKYGEFSGGIVNVATKSGTNAYAGHVGFYFRNDDFVSKPSIIFPGQILDVAPDTRRFYEFALGGPIVKDKVLFFATSEYRDGELGSLFSERTKDSTIFLGSFKLDYLQSEKDRWNFFLSANMSNVKNNILDRFAYPEYNYNEKINKYMFSAMQQHIFNEDLFLESHFTFLRISNDLERTDPDAHWSLYLYTPTGTYSTGRYGVEKAYWRNRVRLTESLSYFKGIHNIGIGFEIGKMNTDGHGQSGPTIFDLRPLGTPLSWHYYFDPQKFDHVKGTEAALYFQDSIILNERLTIDAGLRVEYQSMMGNTDIAPRFGFSYDVTGDRKTKLYANAGIYYDRIYGYYLQFSTAAGGEQYTVYNPVGPLASGVEILDVKFLYFPVGEQKTPYNFTWSAGFERLLPYDMKFNFNYTEKTLKHQLLTYREDLPGVLGFAFKTEGGGKYRGAEFVLSKRFTNRFQSLISYTISRARGDGNQLYQFYTKVQIPPRNAIEDFDRTHYFKASGTMLLPWDVMLAANYHYASGLPYSIIGGAQIGIYYVGERNGQRMPSSQSLDFSLRKIFTFDRYKFTVVFEGYNITNHTNVTSVSTAPDNHGEPSALDISRTFQLGFTFDF